MAKYIDVRNSDGQLIVLGGALVLPYSSNPTTSNLAGSLRYNTGTQAVEVWNGAAWTGPSGSGIVTSFNTRTGAISLLSSDVTTALGFTPVSAAQLGVANGVATLNGSGQLTSSQIPSSLVGAVVYQGTWNASTNTPTLTSSTGTKGFYYAVSVAGTTNLDGITQWNVGDYAIFNGTIWEKIDGVQSEVTSVAGRTGAVVLSIADIGGLSTVSNNTILANITGVSGAMSANSLSAILDSSFNNAQGDVLYRGATGWTFLAPGTSGNFLQTQGASADPIWAPASGGGGGVTQVNSGTGLTGGPITTTGTISLASVADATILANISGVSAAPTANTLTAIIDHDIDNTQGDILYRGATTWSALTPGTSGYVLQTLGAASNPQWASPSSILDSFGAAQGDVLYRGASGWVVLAPGTSGLVLQTKGAAANPVWATASNVLDTIDATQGDILYRSGSAWVALPAGTSGAVLQTKGASANPQWEVLTYADLPAEIQNSLAQVSLPGQPAANAKCMIMAITQNTQVPANFAGSSGYSFTNATASSAFAVGYVHLGTPTAIGTFTFSSAGKTPALSTQAAVNLVAGDVLYMTTPVSQDATLADVGITLVLLKQ